MDTVGTQTDPPCWVIAQMISLKMERVVLKSGKTSNTHSNETRDIGGWTVFGWCWALLKCPVVMSFARLSSVLCCCDATCQSHHQQQHRCNNEAGSQLKPTLVDRFGLPWPSNQGYPANKECLNRCFPHISSYIWRQKWDGSKFKPYRDH